MANDGVTKTITRETYLNWRDNKGGQDVQEETREGQDGQGLQAQEASRLPG